MKSRNLLFVLLGGAAMGWGLSCTTEETGETGEEGEAEAESEAEAEAESEGFEAESEAEAESEGELTCSEAEDECFTCLEDAEAKGGACADELATFIADSLGLAYMCCVSDCPAEQGCPETCGDDPSCETEANACLEDADCETAICDVLACEQDECGTQSCTSDATNGTACQQYFDDCI